MIYDSLTDLIGKTPMIRLKNIEKELGLNAKLIAKLEGFNPAGSAKDRVAKEIIESLKNSGKLNENTVIIEPTSGNTGIAIASICATLGIKAKIVMPDTMSSERMKLISAYGAELILTPGALGMAGAIKKAEELNKEIPGSFIAGQFVNPKNPDAHFKTTGPEIYEDTDGNVDIFVAGVGTGGTITGVGKYLKSKNKDIKIVAVEPADSPVLSGGKAGTHKLQGIGAGFVPEVLDTKIYDEIITATTPDAYNLSRLMGKKEGVLVGISSGASLFGAVTLAKREENKGKTIVALLPDSGERYLSTDLYE